MKILYVDDEEKALNSFKNIHANNGISVESCQDAYYVTEMLENRKKSDLPDLIVMDLYRTKSELNSNEAEDTNRKVEDLITKISDTRKELEALVNNQKNPAGIQALERIRQSSKLKEMPVILITREGLNLLGDGLIRQSIKLGADWMIKGRAPEVMRELMFKKFKDSQSAKRKPKRDIVMMIVGIILTELVHYLLSLIKMT